MRIIRRSTFIILISTCTYVTNINAQTTGSLYLLPENYYSQMLNPAFSGGNNSTIYVAIPLLAGGTFGNSGNFKFTNLLRRQDDGKMALDIEYFYKLGIATTKLSDWSAVPLIYLRIPFKKGKLNFYIKDQLFVTGQFKTEAIDFFNNGNYYEKYRSYNTDDGEFNGAMCREFAVGYTTKLTKKLSFGINGKVLFGILQADLNNWNYGIETSDRGDAVLLSARGKGKLSLPFDLRIENGRIHDVQVDNIFGKYTGSYQNPGFALDLGFDYKIDELNKFAVSVTDLGGIWFRRNAYNINQNSSYDFKGFDISNSLDNNQSENFIDSRLIISNAKENIRNVYRPEADTSEFFTALRPKAVLHYQYDITDRITIGATNQTIFFHKDIYNAFSISSKQKLAGFTFFENINLNKINTVSFGGGVQWEGSFLQLFFGTDNFLALYHPADQKSFTFSFGMCLLFNKQPRGRKGSFLDYLPFYEKKRK